MKRTALALTTIIALLFSAIAITPCVKLVSARTFITIKADGSVSPSTPAIQQIGDLYILTSDIGSIDIERSNMALDGNGHTLQGGVGGITLKSVKNVTVKNLIIKASQYGVYLSECSNITISNNTITGTQFLFPSEPLGGIVVREGNHSTIVGNRLENNFFAINLAVNNSTISENNIVNNNKGIFLLDASDNNIYHNNFINNNENVVNFGIKSSQLNTWDDGKEGNYWSDYNGLDLNGDGIGGWPYRICFNNQDRYPLMKPWEPDVAPPHIFISSPENKTYNDSNFTLAFSTSEPTSKISYSLDGQNNVTITGNTTLNKVPNGSHNLTVYATDHSGNTGASKTISFNVEVPEPFPTTLTATLGSIVAVACFGLLIYFKKRRKEAGEKA
jgi:parallel beta-helix repeat protein